MALDQDDDLDFTDPPDPTPSGTGKPGPIGVPSQMYDKNGKLVPYSVRGQYNGREELGDIRFRRSTSYGIDIPPKYFDGDEYIPTNWPTHNIFQMQQWLAQVGLLTGSFTKNVWDPASQKAYKELLGMANRTGTTADQMLAELLATAGDEKSLKYKVDQYGNIVVASEGGAEKPPLTIRTSDPAALRTTFRKAVIETLGEGWSEEKINQMVAAYNKVEAKAQTDEYNAMYGAGGTVTAPPSPEDFIESQAIAQDPGAAQVQEGLGFTNQFMQAVTAPAWGVG